MWDTVEAVPIRTVRVPASIALGSLLAGGPVLACAPGSTPSPASKPEPVAKADAPATPTGRPDTVTPAGPPQPGESRVLTGTLRYTEIPATKSVASFRSEYLTLVGDGGETWNLGGTEAVPDDKLIPLAGKRLEVTATYVPEAAPDPNAQAPMDGDQTMRYPARWDVTAVRALAP